MCQDYGEGTQQGDGQVDVCVCVCVCVCVHGVCGQWGWALGEGCRKNDDNGAWVAVVVMAPVCQ